MIYVVYTTKLFSFDMSYKKGNTVQFQIYVAVSDIRS